jgi:hypothetical protein
MFIHIPLMPKLSTATSSPKRDRIVYKNQYAVADAPKVCDLPRLILQYLIAHVYA